MVRRKRSTRLTGRNPLAYIGVNPLAPVNFTLQQRSPTINDRKNFNIGDFWLNTANNSPPRNEDLYMLVSVDAGVATWVNFGGGNVETLTGNTGGAVGFDAAFNIDVVGDIAQGITVAGNPATNTLTVKTVSGNNILQSLTGNAGGAVFPDGSNNIDLLGTVGEIVTTGNPGANTITLSLDGAVSNSFVTDAGTATPAGGILNILGTSVLNTSGSGNTVSVNMDNGTDGQVIIGATGLDPAWASITSASITITPGPNSLNFEYAAPTADSSFFAYLSANANNVTGDNTVYIVICDTELFDVGNDYNNATGRFVCPFDGVYYFSSQISFISSATGGTQVNGRIANLTSGLNFATDNFPTNNQVANFLGYNNAISVQGGIFIPCSAGDEVVSRIQSGNAAATDDIEGGNSPIVTYFFGYLAYRT